MITFWWVTPSPTPFELEFEDDFSITLEPARNAQTDLRCSVFRQAAMLACRTVLGGLETGVELDDFKLTWHAARGRTVRRLAGREPDGCCLIDYHHRRRLASNQWQNSWGGEDTEPFRLRADGTCLIAAVSAECLEVVRNGIPVLVFRDWLADTLGIDLCPRGMAGFNPLEYDEKRHGPYRMAWLGMTLAELVVPLNRPNAVNFYGQIRKTPGVEWHTAELQEVVP